MRIAYAFDNVLPSEQADSEQAVNTASALAKAGVRIDLLVPRTKGVQDISAEDLREYYGVEGNFGLRQLPSSFSSYRPLNQLVHAHRAARAIDSDVDLVYTRNIAVLAAALRAGHQVVYEHFRPWPDQYPPLQPVLRHLMSQPNFLGAVLHSHHAKASYRALGLPDSKLTVIHNGYEPKRALPKLSVQQARRKLSMPLDRKIVVYAGRVNQRKGLDVVLEMARHSP